MDPWEEDRGRVGTETVFHRKVPGGREVWVLSSLVGVTEVVGKRG